jgi:hypothetical protein
VLGEEDAWVRSLSPGHDVSMKRFYSERGEEHEAAPHSFRKKKFWISGEEETRPLGGRE